MDAFSYMTEDHGDAGDVYEEQWISVTVVGCPYEQEMELRSGAMRHRKLIAIPPSFREGKWNVIQQHPNEGWLPGPAPWVSGGYG